MINPNALNNVSTLIQERMVQTETPSVALAVVSGDQLAYARGFGITSTDPEQAVAVTPQTVFRIGSSTKPLTGTLLMRLVEAGQLSLDEPIITSLPWFRLSRPGESSLVTLRHLMSHQSGLPWGADFFGSRDPEGLEAYVREQVPRMPLIAPPGVLFSYSNVGVNVAGCVAQAVGGDSFASLMQTWVFDPLGMERTTFDPLRTISFPFAQGHEKTEAGMQVRRSEPWAENVAYHPSAMVYSTVLDMANFASLYLNQGVFQGQQILSAESIAEMHRTQVDEYQADGRTVGLNFALTHYRGYRRVGHPGGIGSFGSFFTMLPEVGVGVLLQFNLSAFWSAAEEVVRHIFDLAIAQSSQVAAIPMPNRMPPIEPDPDDWQRTIGTFLGPRSGLVRISVDPVGQALRLSRIGAPDETPLAPLRSDLYIGRNTSTGAEEVVGFIPSNPGVKAGQIDYIMLNGAPCVRIEPNPAFIVDPTQWKGYLGTYQGPDDVHPSGLDILNLTCEDGTLAVHSRNRNRAEEAIPWDDGCFIYRGRFLRFVPDVLDQTHSFTLGDDEALYRRVL